jgi:hypothetical protein
MWYQNDPPGKRIIVSYRTLRRVVGTLGMLLPVLVMMEWWMQCHCGAIRPSISDYYDVQARDLFVGILFTIAWFLFAYRGHDRRDDIAGDAACLFALGVALVPHGAPGYLWAFHFIFAAALFLTLAYFSYFLFTQTGGTAAQMTAEKVKRNGVYRACAIIMVLAIIAIGVYKLLGATFTIGPVPVVFALEALALEAFGVSWMVKGETILRDKGST